MPETEKYIGDVSLSASTKGLDLQQMANMYNDDGMRGEAPDLHMCNLKVSSFGVWVVLCCVVLGVSCGIHTTCKSLETAVQARPWRILPYTANDSTVLRALSAQFLVSSPLG